MSNNPSVVEQELVVLFADVCGSTRLYEVLGDTAALAAISDCLAVVRRVTQAHVGRVVKTLGDEIMAVFPDSVIAARAACEMQSQVAAMPAKGEVKLAIRVGFNFGPVLENRADGDVFGDTVNVAARMASVARSGQIIAPEASVARLPAFLRSSIRSLEAVSVKGKTEDVRIVEVVWHDSDDSTMVASRTHVPGRASITLRLAFAGREFVLEGNRNTATLGRDPGADIVIDTRTASRTHARIERRRDRFVLIDQSTNGSYVTIGKEPEIRVMREELVLRGNGSISLGQSCSKDPANAIGFYCADQARG